MLSSSSFINKGRKTAASDQARKPSFPADVNLDYQGVDLQLPPELTPLTEEDFQSSCGWRPLPSRRLADSLGYDLTYGIGSCQVDDEVYFRHDTGLFQCVIEAWMNHWNLRTTPEDGWFQVACTIAKAVGQVAKGDDRVDVTNVARILFLPEYRHNQTEKETISVAIPAETIEDQVDYERFFKSVTEQLHKNIRIPEYVEAMQNDFSTSQLTHKIASQINIMSSLQEFFEYRMTFFGCGLRGVEMAGDQVDWDRLVEKLRTVRELLLPLKESYKYRLRDEWWDHVEMVFANLALTKREPENPSVIKFWSDILLNSEEWEHESLPYGMKGPRTHQVPAYDGWLIRLLVNRPLIKVKELESGEFCKELSGLNQVPLIVEMTWPAVPIVEETQLMAGIMGFKLVSPDATFNGIPSLQPFHMWAMMLNSDSKLRGPHLSNEEEAPAEIDPSTEWTW